MAKDSADQPDKTFFVFAYTNNNVGVAKPIPQARPRAIAIAL
jgi:hypothetical protein